MNRFGPLNEHLWNCLSCGQKIGEFTYDMNNGTCDTCPRLTDIAPQFWKVILHLANRGDLNAQETVRIYS